MKIGVSLPPNLLLGKMKSSAQEKLLFCRETGSPSQLLIKLREAGVSSIELRTVKHDSDPAEILAAASAVWEAGLIVTIHGEIRNVESAAEDVMLPLLPLLEKMPQDSLTVTIHGLNGEDSFSNTLLAIRNLIENTPDTIRIALELSRRKRNDVGMSSRSELMRLKEILQEERLGFCWDVGHDLWNIQSFGEENVDLRSFARKVIHTHIHGMKNSTTHFPVRGNHAELKGWMDVLRQEKYSGIYNLELEPERWPERAPVFASYVDSVEYLKELFGITEDRLPRWGKNYLSIWERLFSESAKAENDCCVWQQYHAGYLVRTNDKLWGMDFYLPSNDSYEAIQGRLTDDLSRISYYFLTHFHEDHFDKRILKAFENTKTLMIVPDFLLEDFQKSCNIPAERIQTVHSGDTVRFGELEVNVFESSHSAPPYSIVPEYGYLIRANGKRLLFPGDIRDYASMCFPESCREPDVLFSHVWFGSVDALKPKDETLFHTYISFTKKLNAKRIFLAHLNEQNRLPYQRWTNRHAAWIQEEFPGAEVMRPGEKWKL